LAKTLLMDSAWVRRRPPGESDAGTGFERPGWRVRSANPCFPTRGPATIRLRPSPTLALRLYVARMGETARRCARDTGTKPAVIAAFDGRADRAMPCGREGLVFRSRVLRRPSLRLF